MFIIVNCLLKFQCYLFVYCYSICLILLQLASVILKQYVKTYWTIQPDEYTDLVSSSDQKINESVPGEPTKIGIRQTLIHGLGDPLSKIRTTVV